MQGACKGNASLYTSNQSRFRFPATLKGQHEWTVLK
jgi:hypothetical protein